jgi:imidazolonepropionase-like amidohydrolase
VRFALAAGFLLAFMANAVAQDSLVIHDVTIIDGTGAPPQTHRDLVLRDGRIASIEDASAFTHPPGAQVIDGQGKYVIPGLIDMHAHVAGDVLNEKGLPGNRWDRDIALSLLRTFLQFGVTTIRDPGAITADALVLRRLLAEGKVTGPRLFTAGRILTNTNFQPPGFVPVHNERDVREEVRWQALAGVDFIKIYSSMPPKLTGVAIEEGHRLGVPVIGHLQRTTWTEAARLGIDGLEHAAPWSADYVREDVRTAMPGGMFARVYWLQHLDMARIDEMIAALVTHRVVVDPTLMATMYTKFWADDPRVTASSDLAYVPARLRTGWAAGGFTRNWTAAQFAEAKRSWPILLSLIKTMFDRGVTLVAGSDTPTPWIVPGASLHDELKLLTDAGIPPLQVIRIATSNAARALRQAHELGSIAPGLRADLVMVSKNPLDDITHTRAIALVVQEGRVVFTAP